MDPYTAAFDVSTDAWEAAAEAFEKAEAAPDQAERVGEVDVGETPAEVIYSENKLDLLRYDVEAAGITPENDHETPILIVYALINRPYILDLQPDRSVVRRLLEDGFDVYLIDWGEPSQLDASLTLSDYVDRYIDNCVDATRDDAGVDSINLLGYCMGGTMSTMYTALHEKKVKNLGMMAAGLCFTGNGGVLELWGGEEHFDPGTIAETFGTVPAEFFEVGFDLMDPIQNTVSKYVRLYDNVEDDDFVENFARMETWLADSIDMSGATYEQFIEKIYQENALYENDLYLGEKHVDVRGIETPILQLVAEYDHLVPPAASKPFNDVVASDDTEVMEVSAGHIGMSVSSRAHETLWPNVCDWFAERDTHGTDLKAIQGVGPAYADRLREAGIEVAEELAEADTTALSEETGVAEDRVAEWIDRAIDLTA
ncbi:MAG: class III poly(R)-hydroxyalkanoic acid synthase subunit PhaC [Halobacteriales archaeon]